MLKKKKYILMFLNHFYCTDLHVSYDYSTIFIDININKQQFPQKKIKNNLANKNYQITEIMKISEVI